MGHQKDADLVFLWPYDVTRNAAINVFDDDYCKGQSAFFFANTEENIPAQYTQDEMWDHDYGNNKASSIMVPFGFTTTLYDSNSWDGNSVTIDGEYWTDPNQSMTCINLKDDPYDFNNKLTSLEVTKLGIYGKPAIGYWESLSTT